MTVPIFPAGLAELAGHYDAILCDVWGVVHNGQGAFAESCRALQEYRAQGGKVVLITNAPVPTARVTAVFDRVGVPHDIFDDCATSGDATRNELARRNPSSVWIYAADGGLEHDRFLYQGLGLEIERSAKADLVLCIGLRDQFEDHPEDYRAEMTEMVAAGLTMVCANPDIQVRVGDRLGWCAGALAAIYEELGGQVVYPGKPHPAIYRLALDKLAAIGGTKERSRILAIGDGPVTDIRGANREGLDCLYVGTGLAQYGGGHFGDEIGDLLGENSVSATYAMPILKW